MLNQKVKEMKCIRVIRAIRVRYITLSVTLTVLSGCAGGLGISSLSSDGIVIQGTAEGMSSFGRMVHGSKDKTSPYWPLQHEEELTKRGKYKVNMPKGSK